MGVLFQYTRTYFRLPILIFLSSETNMKQWRTCIIYKNLKIKNFKKKRGGGAILCQVRERKKFSCKKNQQIYINSLFQNLFFFQFRFLTACIYSILSYLLFSINCGSLVYFYNSRPNFPFTSRHSYQFASPILSAFQYAAQSWKIFWINNWKFDFQMEL